MTVALPPSEADSRRLRNARVLRRSGEVVLAESDGAVGVRAPFIDGVQFHEPGHGKSRGTTDKSSLRKGEMKTQLWLGFTAPSSKDALEYSALVAPQTAGDLALVPKLADPQDGC